MVPARLLHLTLDHSLSQSLDPAAVTTHYCLNTPNSSHGPWLCYPSMASDLPQGYHGLALFFSGCCLHGGAFPGHSIISTDVQLRSALASEVSSPRRLKQQTLSVSQVKKSEIKVRFSLRVASKSLLQALGGLHIG